MLWCGQGPLQPMSLYALWQSLLSAGYSHAASESVRQMLVVGAKNLQTASRSVELSGAGRDQHAARGVLDSSLSCAAAKPPIPRPWPDRLYRVALQAAEVTIASRLLALQPFPYLAIAAPAAGSATLQGCLACAHGWQRVDSLLCALEKRRRPLPASPDPF